MNMKKYKAYKISISKSHCGSDISALRTIGVGRPVADEFGAIEDQTRRALRFNRFTVVANIILQQIYNLCIIFYQ